MLYFNPQGPRGPRPDCLVPHDPETGFQSTRPSRASTEQYGDDGAVTAISIHKALAGLDDKQRLEIIGSFRISIHKALAGLDWMREEVRPVKQTISIHKALAGLDSLGLIF